MLMDHDQFFLPPLGACQHPLQVQTWCSPVEARPGAAGQPRPRQGAGPDDSIIGALPGRGDGEKRVKT